MFGYRREIDGLRALAVVPVILFHAGFEAFSGGFVGVDVFFVISGYLITSIIFAQKAAGTFSLLDFYERRARRVLPALFLVMAVCIPFAWLWLLPGDMKDFSQSIVAVSVFASNILFWWKSGYFDTAAELKPLLHTWSLAVEEQYYVLFPLFLLVMWRFAKRWTVATLTVIAALSFALAQWGAYNKPAATFFLLPTRGWEIAIGALIAFYFARYPKLQLQRPAQEAGSLIGLSLILYAVFAYSKATPFPSAYALAPTLGTALIILCTTPSTLVGRILTTKAFVGVGLISYSAYLWHQPLFAFFRQIDTEADSVGIYIALSGISFFLAYLTWRFIETPFRKKPFRRSTVFAATFSVAGLFFVMGIYGAQDGLKNRFERSVHTLLESFDRDSQVDYVTRSYNNHAKAKRDWSNSGDPKVLLIGDSYSQDLFNAVSEIGLKNRLDIILRYIPFGCGVLFIDKQKIVETADKVNAGLCKREVALIEDDWLMEKVRSAEHIWLASSWLEKHLDFMNESLSRLRSYTQADIVVFGVKHFPKLKKDHLAYTVEERAALVDDLSGTLSAQEKMVSIMKKEQFIDVQSVMCESNKDRYSDCKLFDSQGMPKSHDGSHLTKYGATFYGKSIERFLRCSLFKDCEVSNKAID